MMMNINSVRSRGLRQCLKSKARSRSERGRATGQDSRQHLAATQRGWWHRVMCEMTATSGKQTGLL